MPRIRASSLAEHKTQTRVEMLDAAAALFMAQGYMETSLGDVAGYVGVGRTTLYEYFSDKEDLLASLVESRIPEVIDGLIDGLPASATIREQLAELMIRALDFITSTDNLGTLLMRETPRLGPDAQERIRASHQRLQDEITTLCRRGIESGEFRAFEVEEVSRLVFSVMWSASRTLLHDSDAKQRRHEAAETVVRFVFDGLASSQ
jgi:AcrR family transcriptional regulator